MNKYLSLLLLAALAANGYCAELSFDKGIDAAQIAAELGTGKEFNGPRPVQPQGPGHNGPGGHGGNHHGGGQHWNNGHDRRYVLVYPDMNCRVWEFTAQTPGTRSESLSEEELSADCYVREGTEYCRTTGRFLSRKVTVNIGAHRLEPWEKETMKVCLDNYGRASLGLDGMAYEYNVSAKDREGIFGKDSTVFSLVPGARKPVNPDPGQFAVTFAGVAAGGDVRMTITDSRASYFSGEKMEISVEGMNIPHLDPGMSPDEIAGAFVKINARASFDVAPSYDIKLLDAPKAGTYAVTVKFSRKGPLSSGAAVSLLQTFELR
ncbi:MAG TPA: hypothetical protein PKI19_08035 [Elusimicrobiales bacterium]|nr:hypothetical protein [Elusimicrobiales bacterium]